MARAVLIVNSMPLDNGRHVNTCAIDESFNPAANRALFALNCDASDPAFAKLKANPPQVREAGVRLYEALRANQACADLLAQWQAAPPPAPIFFHVDSPQAEALPWETLYDTEFRALNLAGAYPIARLASSSGLREPIRRRIGRSLRMVIVLAAARIAGLDEWRNIAGSIETCAMDVDLLVLVSEEKDHDGILEQAADWQRRGLRHRVDVQYTGDGETLMRRIAQHLPNLVHFFCHGVADVKPQLELASRSDSILQKDRGSISLDLDLLKPLAAIDTVWLVVLNCCQGARQAPQLHSLARDLVAAGIPSAVAMRESIEVNDANLFANHFYGNLLAQLEVVFEQCNAAPGPRIVPMPELLCVSAVDTARRRLVNQPRQAATSIEWTFPIVYLHRDRLELQVGEIQVAVLSSQERDRSLAQLGALKAMLAAMQRDPGAHTDGIAARIEALQGALYGQ